MPYVLLAGKDWAARTLLRAQLIEDGLDVEAHERVADADDALQRRWAGRGVPSLLIANLFVSEDLAKDLATLSHWVKLLPVWIMTGHGATEATAKGLENLGFERLLFRPLDIGKLVKEIKERLAAG